ncbi:MAG: tol-pal system protein YbgF [Rhodospirillaceae bacterium]|nr:tol-pal system protein YbgF [Rhodospirillaceae bacterium]
MGTVEHIKRILVHGFSRGAQFRSFWHRGVVHVTRVGASGIAVFLCLGVVSSSGVIAQQNNDLEFLIAQISRLSKDITGIQQRLANGDTIAGDAVGGWSPTNHETRLSELEEQIRSLTGQVEEAGHGVTQTIEALNSLTQDLHARLQTMEERLSSVQRNGISQDPAPSAVRAPGVVDEEVIAIGDGDPSDIAVVAKDPNMEVYESMEVLGEITSGETIVGSSNGELDSLSMEPSAEAIEEKLTAEESYAAAYGLLLKKRDYVSAEKALKSFIEEYPEHSLAGNAYYWLGETFYVRNNYVGAAKAFANGYDKFPEGAKAPDNLLKLGLSLKAMGKNDDACTIFGKLTNNYPEAPAVIVTRLNQEWVEAACS